LINSKPNILQQLTGGQLKLSKSDQKLVKVILDQPHDVIHLSIARLARLAEVSEPTVNRFCHKLKCKGYPEFKLRLAQELSASGQLFVEHVSADDSAQEIIQKTLTSVQSNVQTLGSSLDAMALTRAAEQIAQCQTVNFFGMGASSSVALDAQHKFFRFGIPVSAHTDFINQRMMCSMLSQRDVAVFISYTGRTEAIVHHAKLAQEAGATVIGITSSASPLAASCQIILNVLTHEDTDLYTPMTSRLLHLAVIDMLATRVALLLGKEVEKNIRAIKSNLASTRLDYSPTKKN